MKRTASVAVLVLIGAGCSASVGPSASGPSTVRAGVATTTPTDSTSPDSTCATPTRFGIGGAANEIRGVSRDGQLWGLAFGPGRVPPRAGDELKIVWRMTGRGALRVVFTAPDGRRRPLVFGPEAHSASSYHRPGDEWGTGFRFAFHGCWHIHLARDDTSADVWLDVPPST